MCYPLMCYISPSGTISKSSVMLNITTDEKCQHAGISQTEGNITTAYENMTITLAMTIQSTLLTYAIRTGI